MLRFSMSKGAELEIKYELMFPGFCVLRCVTNLIELRIMPRNFRLLQNQIAVRMYRTVYIRYMKRQSLFVGAGKGDNNLQTWLVIKM
jgi:hypothetical protein